MSLVECVPNFSEGLRQAVIDEIVSSIASVPGVDVLDHSSDADHNRSVVTFAGQPDAVVEAAFKAIETAAAHINLEQHNGVHPRIGATDVVPFIPLRDISLDDCAMLARRLGERVGIELEIPVYLYEKAASRAERVNLADIRRGGYERLKTAIEQDSARAPDFGPARMGPAGAVAIGARGPLIAFNAYLDTVDVEIAQRVAGAIRESGGGLRFLKALGLLVGGRAQVSMNVIDYRQTGLYAILESVRSEAAKYGAVVTNTELVGLIPQSALIDTALAYLGLPATAYDHLLEGRIGAATGDYREIPFE